MLYSKCPLKLCEYWRISCRHVFERDPLYKYTIHDEAKSSGGKIRKTIFYKPNSLRQGSMKSSFTKEKYSFAVSLTKLLFSSPFGSSYL